MTSQTTQTVQFVVRGTGLSDWSPPLRVDEWLTPLTGRFAGGVAAAEQGEADRKDAVSNCSRVGSCTGEQEEEELQVRQQED